MVKDGRQWKSSTKLAVKNFVRLVYFFSTLRESQMTYLNNTNLHNNIIKNGLMGRPLQYWANGGF